MVDYDWATDRKIWHKFEAHAVRLGSLRNAPEIVLERALDGLLNFWIFVSMCLIVRLAFVVVDAIAVFARASRCRGFRCRAQAITPCSTLT